MPCDLGPVIDAAGGLFHTVALDANGTVHAWGAGSDPSRTTQVDFGQSAVPANLGPAVRVGAGSLHSIAQLPDGTLRLWGRNDYGQCNVPSGVTSVIGFAGGGLHTAVLLPDGTVRCFGAGAVTPVPNVEPEYGQVLVPERVGNANHADFVPVTQVAAGLYFTVALRQDGSVVAWGDNTYGQCVPPANLGRVVKIAAGRSHCIALREDGSIAVWGGITGADADNVRLAQVPAALKFAVDIAAGFRCNIGTDADGRVYVWGSLAGTQADKQLVPANLGSADRVWGIGRHLLARMGPPVADSDNDGDPDAYDCNDSDAAINRQAVELCNGIDDDCDGSFDETYSNIDGDAYGDECDSDDDGDGYDDGVDNCPLVSNAAQTNTDNDSYGDACDSDDDGDGWGEL